MPRRPIKPRYWPSKGGYYLTVEKRTYLLARGSRDDPAVLAHAKEKASELLAQVNRSRPTVRNIITPEEREALAEAAAPHLLHALDVLALTGCRPEEAVAVTAADLDYEAEAVRLHRPERLIQLGDAWTVYYHLAMDRRVGPILRNSKGKPWTVDALHGAFCRLRDRLGLDKRLTLMSFRHAYAESALFDMNFREGDTPEKLAERLGISVAHLRDLYWDMIPTRFWA